MAGPALRALGPGNSWLVGVVFCAQCGNRVGSLVKPSGADGVAKKERKKTDNPREGWEDGTPPPHRDFKERSVMR